MLVLYFRVPVAMGFVYHDVGPSKGEAICNDLYNSLTSGMIAAGSALEKSAQHHRSFGQLYCSRVGAPVKAWN